MIRVHTPTSVNHPDYFVVFHSAIKLMLFHHKVRLEQNQHK